MTHGPELFQVSINVQLNRLRDDGAYLGSSSGGLQINETLQVRADGFLDVCKILSQFHELAQSLEKKK